MTLPQSEPMFFYIVAAQRVRSGDVLYEINDRPLRGGPMAIDRIRHAPAESGKRSRDGWELIPPAECSRFSRFVNGDARLKVSRITSARRINPIVAAAAKPRRTSNRRKPVDADQLPLFEAPVRRK